MLRTIILNGTLGDIIGREWKLDVASPKEAIHAINCLTNGKLVQVLNSLKQTLDGYFLDLDGNEIRHELEYEGTTSAEVFEFHPAVIGGAKNKGFLQIILGVVLIVVGCIFGANPYLIQAGLGMVLGGIIQLLTPTPNYKETEGERSTTLGGTVNTTRQGLPVPLGYGEMVIGSQCISIGTTNVDTFAGLNSNGGIGGNSDALYAKYTSWHVVHPTQMSVTFEKWKTTYWPNMPDYDANL